MPARSFQTLAPPKDFPDNCSSLRSPTFPELLEPSFIANSNADSQSLFCSSWNPNYPAKIFPKFEAAIWLGKSNLYWFKGLFLFSAGVIVSSCGVRVWVYLWSSWLGVLLALSGWGPGVLLSIPQCPGWPHTENDPATSVDNLLKKKKKMLPRDTKHRPEPAASCKDTPSLMFWKSRSSGPCGLAPLLPARSREWSTGRHFLEQPLLLAC